ncbi:para-aminobenzoate synthetase component 1 [Pedobacter sp. CAN_A7]|uniref:anthranilate synthase component I family protein n=1 Tax=Pedobacter sp. CAN_A7 TaxID=2787722 RepID=UPI0018CA6BCA
MNITDPIIKAKALQWADGFEVCCVLDNNQYQNNGFQAYDLLIAAGVKSEVQASCGQAFNALKDFYDVAPDWMFGLLSYDLKNETEDLQSNNPDELNFPDLYFFRPQYLIAFKNDIIEVLIGDHTILHDLASIVLKAESLQPDIEMKASMSKETYMGQVKKLQQHIQKGDCYEVTFCQEYHAASVKIDPLSTYRRLNHISPAPFSSYFKIKDHYILSASPERFLRKRGQQLISQPIKGTTSRSADPVLDEQLRKQLKENLKEQTENVMIVDLVRNDLTKSSKPGSVKVTELFGIYSFPQVHQMISTVQSELHPDLHFLDALKNTFPMGSMTGAPKIRAMQLIEDYENRKRGAYSGSVGYITPTGDFDFNVLIRTLLYQASYGHLSFQVGGAITYGANAESEYEECQLKASALLQTLKGLPKQPF